MNSFEKYLKKNKGQLNQDSLNPDIWLTIENQVLRRKSQYHRRVIRWISAAAAVLLIGCLSLYLMFPRTINSSDLLAEYGLESRQFNQQVNRKIQFLDSATIPKDRKKDFDLLLQQLEFLDTQYQDYLQYIQQSGYQEFIGKQILTYYKTKIELLDKIQQEIEKINYYEKKYNKNSPQIQLDI